MIITDVQPRRHRLSQLFIDGEAAVKVDTETWLRSGLMPGDEIIPAKKESWKQPPLFAMY